MNAPIAILDVEEQSLWRRYQELEELGCRRESLPVLGEFTERLLAYEPARRVAWVRELLRGVALGTVTSPIRHPLFRSVVLPVLLDDYRNEVPGTPRLLMLFRHQIHGGSVCREVIGDTDLSDFAILDKALLQEPDAPDLLQLRVNWYASNFEYAVHEVPDGVLFGFDGASITQCDRLLTELDEFLAAASKLGVATDYASQVDEWRLHFRAYRDYLLKSDQYKNYESYLNAHYDAW